MNSKQLDHLKLHLNQMEISLAYVDECGYLVDVSSDDSLMIPVINNTELMTIINYLPITLPCNDQMICISSVLDDPDQSDISYLKINKMVQL
jgi:hypothetical protein